MLCRKNTYPIIFTVWQIRRLTFSIHGIVLSVGRSSKTEGHCFARFAGNTCGQSLHHGAFFAADRWLRKRNTVRIV